MTGKEDEVQLVPYWKILLDFENYHESISYHDMLKRMMKEFFDQKYGVQNSFILKFRKVKFSKSEIFLSRCKTVNLKFSISEEYILHCFERYCKEESISKTDGLKTIMKTYIYSRLGDGSVRNGYGIPPIWNYMIFR